jgi:hypothetical protein
MPVPKAWLSSPEFSGLLRGNVYEQKFLVGKVDSPGTERGTSTTPEGGVYVPITDDIKGNLMATYSGDSGIEEFLRDITPKSVPIGGTSRPTGGTSRPAQPRSNTPAPPSSGGAAGRGSKENADELRRRLSGGK